MTNNTTARVEDLRKQLDHLRRINSQTERAVRETLSELLQARRDEYAENIGLHDMWRVPDYDEDVPEAMIEWLDNVDRQWWEGDESGIAIYSNDGDPDETDIAAPGNYLVIHEGRLVRVKPHQQTMCSETGRYWVHAPNKAACVHPKFILRNPK